MKTIAATALITLAVLLSLVGCERDERPNVLLITLDTTRADYLGCYGQAGARTPVMDRMAVDGVQFMHNISTSQCTNPSHASILTGLYLARHGVYNNHIALSSHAVTLAEVLKDQGYATLAAVSAHHLNPGNSAFDQGFDHFLECDTIQITASERNERLLPALQGLGGKPFFAWVHYFDPHGNYEPPMPYDSMHPRTDVHDSIASRKTMDIKAGRKPGTMVDPDEIIALYRGEISYLDFQIGRLLETLDHMGVAQNTLVVLVADHGESMGEKDLYFCHAGLYNQVIHVPLIMRWPGGLPADHRVESLTSSADIYPTILELIDVIPKYANLSGRNLVPTFDDGTHQVHDTVISEAVNGVIRCVHQGEYRYIKPYPRDWSMQTDHLYRSFVDYSEDHDLKHTEVDLARQLEQLLTDRLAEAQKQVLPATDVEEIDPKTAEALKSLGYIN